MWSYECVFQEPVRSRKRKFPIRDGSGTTICGEVRDRSETVVSESGELALQYAGALDAAKAGIATLESAKAEMTAKAETTTKVVKQAKHKSKRKR